ncbi:ATP-binding cassette domain-containing protein [Litchfieldia alkalitelluris]|uniref:hypothetical protein n=1 Tax=Litchfieldia alkalitelluris TaxID=304268 RepID=UPI001F48A1AE|nr:hypothetical protein [Litchfieldia alkalitelluris]
MLFQDINLLILDEPTNHLDIDSIETLEEALEDFKGTIFFISHDRYFINKIGERIIALENHSLKSYPGNYDDYNSEKEKVRLLKVNEEPVKTEKIKKQKCQSADMEKEEAKALSRIEKLEVEIQELDKAMVSEQLEYTDLNKLYCRKIELNKEVETVMEKWMDLNN